MRTAEELHAACEAFAWYIASGRLQRQDAETQLNIMGVITALEWMNRPEDVKNPVGHTLATIAKMRELPHSN